MAWKLRRLIKDANGNLMDTHWPGTPGTKLSQQQRMTTEAAVDVSDLNFSFTAFSATAINMVRPNGAIREYDVLEA